MRLNFNVEEQLVFNRLLTLVAMTTNTTSVNYEEQDPSELPKTILGYGEKLAALCATLYCRFKERSALWLKTTKESRPVCPRPDLGCPGPWIA